MTAAHGIGYCRQTTLVLQLVYQSNTHRPGQLVEEHSLYKQPAILHCEKSLRKGFIPNAAGLVGDRT